MSSLSLLGSSPLDLMNTALPSPVDLPRAFCSHSHGFCTQNRQEAGMGMHAGRETEVPSVLW